MRTNFNLYILIFLFFVPLQAMVNFSAKVGMMSNIIKMSNKNSHFLSRFSSSVHESASCACYSDPVIQRSILRPDTLDRWRKFHGQAIRHRISSDIDLHHIEQNEWIVTDEYGKTWKEYDKSAIIKFARKKLLHKVDDDKRLYWTKWDVETEFRDDTSLTQDTQFFILEADQNKISFTSLKNIQDNFSMAINIDDKEIGKINPKKEFGFNKDEMEIARRSVECLRHLDLGIPWYIALKSLDAHKVENLPKHQSLAWVSLSANGQNLLTKTTDGKCYLWSIEHID